MGVVTFTGGILAAGSSTIFLTTLPTVIVPPTHHRFASMLGTGLAAPNNTFAGIVDVLSTAQLRLVLGPATGNNPTVPLDGISYYPWQV
jgi:hypothetical protein